MRKVINGKMYDTETAKSCGYFKKGDSGDLLYIYEELYRKKTGEYFLYASGGAKTKYSKSIGNNMWSGSTQIIPLDYKAAQKWAEKYLNGDEYEEIFGKVPEDNDGAETITTRIPKSTAEKLRRFQSVSGEKIGEIIGKAIENYIK